MPFCVARGAKSAAEVFEISFARRNSRFSRSSSAIRRWRHWLCPAAARHQSRPASSRCRGLLALLCLMQARMTLLPVRDCPGEIILGCGRCWMGHVLVEVPPANLVAVGSMDVQPVLAIPGPSRHGRNSEASRGHLAQVQRNPAISGSSAIHARREPGPLCSEGFNQCGECRPEFERHLGHTLGWARVTC